MSSVLYMPECWDGSDAQRLLRRDIRKGRHLKMKPEYLHMTRTAYKDFDLATFRDHIYQELRAERESNYWIVRRKKKEMRDKAKRGGKLLAEDEIDFDDPVLRM